MNKIQKQIATLQMPVLHLNLNTKWFDMILDEVKREEYRSIGLYWNRIFKNGTIKIKGKYYKPSEVLIVFSNGYMPNRRQMLVNVNHLHTSAGVNAWGADPGVKYYNLGLGKIIATSNCNVSFVQIEKIEEIEAPRHPNNIKVGFTLYGRFHDQPYVGLRFKVGNYWSTSIVTEIINESTFKTLNSVYKIIKIEEAI